MTTAQPEKKKPVPEGGEEAGAGEEAGEVLATGAGDEEVVAGVAEGDGIRAGAGAGEPGSASAPRAASE